MAYTQLQLVTSSITHGFAYLVESRLHLKRRSFAHTEDIRSNRIYIRKIPVLTTFCAIYTCNEVQLKSLDAPCYVTVDF